MVLSHPRRDPTCVGVQWLKAKSKQGKISNFPQLSKLGDASGLVDQALSDASGGHPRHLLHIYGS